MTHFVYIHARSAGVYTVGHYDPSDNQWEPESDHRDDGSAAARAHYLNGGNPGFDQLVAALRIVRKAFETDLRSSPEFNTGHIKIIDDALRAAGAMQ